MASCRLSDHGGLLRRSNSESEPFPISDRARGIPQLGIRFEDWACICRSSKLLYTNHSNNPTEQWKHGDLNPVFHLSLPSHLQSHLSIVHTLHHSIFLSFPPFHHTLICCSGTHAPKAMGTGQCLGVFGPPGHGQYSVFMQRGIPINEYCKIIKQINSSMLKICSVLQYQLFKP